MIAQSFLQTEQVWLVIGEDRYRPMQKTGEQLPRSITLQLAQPDRTAAGQAGNQL
jgi:hypothetical protein